MKHRIIKLTSVLAFILGIFLLSGCALSGVSQTGESMVSKIDTQFDHRQNPPMTWATLPKQEKIDPAFALSKDLSPTLFWESDKKAKRTYPLGVNKKHYRLAIANADSGHAYDAFVASLAYWSGHYKPGKSNHYKAKGRDHYEFRYYLKKAAHLGWPEANLILICYNYLDITGYSTGNLSLSCPRFVSKKIDLKSDISTAKMHFLQAAFHGKYFDQKLKYVGSSLLKENSMAAVMEDWRAHMETSSVISTVQGFGGNKMFSVSDAVKHCKENYAYVLEKAREVEEPNICGARDPNAGFVFVHYTEKLDCPGAGYREARAYLQGCMAHTKSKKDWNYYFDERMDLHHPRQDQDLKIFDIGLAHYKKMGNPKAVEWVSELRAQAATITMQSRGKWEQEYEQNEIAKDLSVARKKAQEEAARLNRERTEREYEIEWKRKQAAWAAADREQKAAWENSAPFGHDPFMENIQRIQDNTMQNINAQQQRLRTTTSPTNNSQQKTYSHFPVSVPGETRTGSRNSEKLSNYEAEKQNCLNAGKKWNNGCDYSTTVEVQGWSDGNRATVKPGNTKPDTTSGADSTSGYGSGSAGQEYGGGAKNFPLVSNAPDAWAYCWETESGNFMCDGPLQLMLHSEKTLSRALESTDCPNGKATTNNWYDCGRKLKWTELHKERDVRSLRKL